MQPGEKLGKYEVLEKIGQGSFGVVYKGRDPFIKRIVAIKVCSADDEDLRKRFFREAQIVGTLQHRNLVTVYDFGIQDEAPFMVQEYLEGEDLSDIIDRRDELPLDLRLNYLIQVAAGLAFAHGEDVIHRDIKPGNIRVLPEDRVKIMDFGIAKLTSSKTRLTQAGTTIGTAGYLSPEQLQATELDPRTDIFSFGVLAYEFLSYERPFRGNTFSKVAYQILYTPPMPLSASWPGCPLELERIISRCLEKRREDRYANCAEIIADLEKLLELDHDGFTEKIVADADDDAPQKIAALTAPPQTLKEVSPEATVAIQLPILPPTPAKERSTQPAPTAQQAPPKSEEVEPKSETAPTPIPDSPSPKTIVLPPRVTVSPKEPTDSQPDHEEADTDASQILSPIDEALPTDPPVERAPEQTPKAEVPAPPEEKTRPIEQSAIEKPAKTPPKSPASKVPAQKVAKAPAKPVAKPRPVPAKKKDEPSAAPAAPPPWVRAREQFGDLPPGLRKAAFAGGALLLLLVVLVALWPSDDGSSPAPPIEEPIVTETIVEEPPSDVSDGLGRLTIDAQPWAWIVAIESSEGESFEIPVRIATPTHFELPEGTWIVTLAPGPLETEEGTPEEETVVEGQQEELIDDASGLLETEIELEDPNLTCRVEVIAGQSGDCRVRFSEADIVDYFMEAGWWN